MTTGQHCRKEVETLREVRELLEAMPPEVVLGGPPDGGELVLQRTLRQVRAEAVGAWGRRRALAAAVAVVVVAVALGLGVVVGHAGPAPVSVPAAAPDPDLAPAPGRRPSLLLSGAVGGLRLSASVTPGDGWARVSARVSGLPDGTPCRLVVVGKDGTRQPTGGWQVHSAPGPAGAWYGSASLPASAIAAVAVEDTAGHEFVRTGV